MFVMSNSFGLEDRKGFEEAYKKEVLEGAECQMGEKFGEGVHEEGWGE